MGPLSAMRNQGSPLPLFSQGSRVTPAALQSRVKGHPYRSSVKGQGSPLPLFSQGSRVTPTALQSRVKDHPPAALKSILLIHRPLPTHLESGPISSCLCHPPMPTSRCTCVRVPSPLPSSSPPTHREYPLGHHHLCPPTHFAGQAAGAAPCRAARRARAAPAGPTWPSAGYGWRGCEWNTRIHAALGPLGVAGRAERVGRALAASRQQPLGGVRLVGVLVGGRASCPRDCARFYSWVSEVGGLEVSGGGAGTCAI